MMLKIKKQNLTQWVRNKALLVPTKSSYENLGKPKVNLRNI